MFDLQYSRKINFISSNVGFGCRVRICGAGLSSPPSIIAQIAREKLMRIPSKNCTQENVCVGHGSTRNFY